MYIFKELTIIGLAIDTFDSGIGMDESKRADRDTRLHECLSMVAHMGILSSELLWTQNEIQYKLAAQ